MTLLEPSIGAITLDFNNDLNKISPTYNTDAPVGVLNYVFEVRATMTGYGLFSESYTRINLLLRCSQDVKNMYTLNLG